MRCDSVVLDGEICCLDSDCRSNFHRLVFRRDWPFFYAFDVLSIDGQHVQELPLTARKRLLRAIMPKLESRLLYLDCLKGRGKDLYRVACDCDLEGIVGKSEAAIRPMDVGRPG